VAELHVDTSTTGTAWGTGGMATKLTAARIACAAGCAMAICNSAAPEAVAAIVAGERRGTVFQPLCGKVPDRKRWILSSAPSS
jgi:glutamate 5-kinase